MSSMNVRDLLRLSAIPGIGANRIRVLISRFGSSTAVLDTPARELVKVEGIDKKIAANIAHQAITDDFLDDQLSRLNKADGRIITIWDEEYPEHLRKIYDPPALLFVAGTVEKCDRFSIAIVGTRRPSVYGSTIAERFAGALAEMGITIVSGLARGVDTIAHRAALQREGRTLAVIGSGLDHIYPPENKKLAIRIEQGGAVLSEFFMGTKPDPGNFPRRNRIISGISLGTVVVETAENGGAMITASTTLDQNRELFAVPGNITEKSSTGTNLLIRDGQAKLVQSIEDIVSELAEKLKPLMPVASARPLPQLTAFEQKVYECLEATPIHIDEIIERTGFSPSDTLVHLLGLEFKGMISQLAGKYFVRL